MSFLADLATYEFLRTALLAGIVAAVLCASIGVFLVLRGMSLLGDGLAHISFAGVALALAVGAMPLPFALVSAVGGAVAIHVLRERQVVKSDTAIGILFTAGLATGILVVSAGTGLSSAHRYLFGTLVAVDRVDLYAILALGAILLAVLARYHREFVYMTFSEEAARVSGLPVRRLNLLFIALSAATIVLAARVMGVLLVSALVVVPAATALQLRRGFGATMLASVGFALASVLAGLWLSVELGTATGATIALVAIALFALVAGARVARGS